LISFYVPDPQNALHSEIAATSPAVWIIVIMHPRVNCRQDHIGSAAAPDPGVIALNMENISPPLRYLIFK
jgi:hypothetical protein